MWQLKTGPTKKWKHGALSCEDKNIRKEAIELFKRGIDFAKAAKADSVLLWPAHDGSDYPFQCGYRDAWKYMIETIQEIGSYDPSVKIAVEYKSKDPRQKMYVSNAGKLMMLLNDVGLDNVTGALDIGHALMAQENIAEILEIMDMHGKLQQIHLNENYKDADPDMIFGTINFWEILEFFYYLNKTDFNGWSSIDIICGRDDRAKSLEMGVKLIWKYQQMAENLMEHSAEIDANIKGYKFAGQCEPYFRTGIQIKEYPLMNSREKFLSAMRMEGGDYSGGVEVPKVEMGYWAGTLRRWFNEGLPETSPLPENISDGVAVMANRNICEKMEKSGDRECRPDIWAGPVPYQISRGLQSDVCEGSPCSR